MTFHCALYNPWDKRKEKCIGLAEYLTEAQCLHCSWGGEDRKMGAAEQYSKQLHGRKHHRLLQLQQGRHFKSYILPGRPVEAEHIAPWRLQKDTVWTAWGGEPRCRSGHCWEDFQWPGTRGSMLVKGRWPLLFSWPPGRCSPSLQFWSWHRGCPARPISPDSPGSASPSLRTRLPFVCLTIGYRHITRETGFSRCLIFHATERRGQVCACCVSGADKRDRLLSNVLLSAASMC